MQIQLKSLRIAFFGTANFAAYHLYSLLYCSIHKIIAVFTQETKYFNQKSLLSIKNISRLHNLLLFPTKNLSMVDIEYIIKKLNVDMIIVVSYGLILTQNILNVPKLGCVNVHGSLLPRWRGSAPIQRALIHGDKYTGISIIHMNNKIDSGNILYNRTCVISPQDNSKTLSKKLAHIGSISLLQTIEKLSLGTYKTISQNSSDATYAYKIKKYEARINWRLSAIQLERNIRAFNPWPISFFKIQNSYIKVWHAKISNQNINFYTNSLNHPVPGTILKLDSNGIHVSTGLGVLILTVLQIPGKKKTSSKDLLNAHYKWLILNSNLK